MPWCSGLEAQHGRFLSSSEQKALVVSARQITGTGQRPDRMVPRRKVQRPARGPDANDHDQPRQPDAPNRTGNRRIAGWIGTTTSSRERHDPSTSGTRTGSWHNRTMIQVDPPLSAPWSRPPRCWVSIRPNTLPTLPLRVEMRPKGASFEDLTPRQWNGAKLCPSRSGDRERIT